MTVALLASSALADPPKPPNLQPMIQTAHRLRDQKKWDEAANACEQIIALPAAEPTRKIEAFEILIDVYRRQKNLDKSLATAARIAAEIPNNLEAQVRCEVLQADLHLEIGGPVHKSGAIAHYAAAAKLTDNPHVRQNATFRIAGIHLADARYEDAIAAYHRVFTESPTVTDCWYESQRGIVEALRKANRPAEALAAARIFLNAAYDANTLLQNASLVAALFKELDKNVTRANAFLDYQQYGPAGKDGQLNTPDDLANPLESIPYPIYKDREQAFAIARQAAGDDAPASRLRALTFVYTGHPSEALQHYAEYFRRSQGEPYPMLGASQELIILGVRGVRGHAVGLERFYDFLRYGPNGPDQLPNTPDDLKDPFAQIGLVPRTASDDGGLVPPSAEQRKALIDLRSALEPMILAERDDTQFRIALLQSIERIHIALCDWGAKGQADWYLGLLADSASNEYVYSTILRSAQAAARGSDLHFAKVLDLYKQLDAGSHGPAGGKFPDQQPQQVRSSFFGFLSLLEKPQPLAPHIPPLK